ncbi:hypothetical protein CY34DRAFT_810562 [Suillus luteus UH-Slu-Lm8-n1]|uniref:Uncharacterized protein n=1 Tax=Suillus luteus UH-Slu-Lm8-n1 TaxID=930992 RepID=A0A0D0AZC7_9AGAM|nr:hypothetical protein CY34DRAFT_810562 [Suillus luteus UH-Slu-Lm8-n1]
METRSDEARVLVIYTDSLFSNAASVEGYREWSYSGKSTPISLDNDTTSGAPMNPPFSSGPAAQLAAQVPHGLVTPRSVVPGHGHTKRIRYAILEVSRPYVFITLSQ